MGLKLQPSCNLLTTLLKNNRDAGPLIFTSQDTRIDLNNRLRKLVSLTGLEQVQGSMDRLLEQNNRECVRNTMMRQEEIFKQQVYELHRLYRVQKLLMSELRTKEAQLHSHATATMPRAVIDAKNKYWSSTSTSDTSHSSYISNRHHTAPQLKSEYNSLHQHSTLAEPTRHKGFNLEGPAEQKATVSHVQSKELWADEDCDVDLSLSIGCSSSKKKPKNRLHPEPTSGTMQLLLSNTGSRQERGEECSERESLQRPPWLFQAMSLNKT